MSASLTIHRTSFDVPITTNVASLPEEFRTLSWTTYPSKRVTIVMTTRKTAFPTLTIIRRSLPPYEKWIVVIWRGESCASIVERTNQRKSLVPSFAYVSSLLVITFASTIGVNV